MAKTPSAFNTVPDFYEGMPDPGRLTASPRNEEVRLNPSKAAAFDTWMARGGGTTKSGRFRKGPMAGMTIDEAKQKFAPMWSAAPDALKEKYAAKGDNDLAPRERKTAVDLPNLGQQGNRMRSYSMAEQRRKEFYDGTEPKTAVTPAHDKDGNGAPDMVQRPAEANAPGSDEARAAALTDVDERFHTASTGNFSAMEAAIGKAKTIPKNTDEELAPVAAEVNARDAAAAAVKRAADEKANQERIAEKQNQARRDSGLPVVAVTPSATEGKTKQGEVPVNKAPSAPGVDSGAKTPAKTPATPARLGATPAGQELVGYGYAKDGVTREAVYKPMAEVYGDSARRAGEAGGFPSSGAVRSTTPGRDDAQIRADYQRRMQTPVAPAPAFVRGPASQTPPVAPPTPGAPSVLDDIRRDARNHAGVAAGKAAALNSTTAKPGEQDYGKSMTDADMEQVNAGVFKKSVSPAIPGRVVSTRPATVEESKRARAARL